MEKIRFPQGKSVNTSSDKETAVLYLSFGEPRASETLDPEEDLLNCFDPETGEITGFTILNLSEFGQEIEELLAARAAA